MILCLISLGKYFEARAKAKTNTALMALAKLMPDKVSVKREEGFVSIASKDLKVGDKVKQYSKIADVEFGSPVRIELYVNGARQDINKILLGR